VDAASYCSGSCCSGVDPQIDHDQVAVERAVPVPARWTLLLAVRRYVPNGAPNGASIASSPRGVTVFRGVGRPTVVVPTSGATRSTASTADTWQAAGHYMLVVRVYMLAVGVESAAASGQLAFDPGRPAEAGLRSIGPCRRV
jgi:hypothetical protein